MPEPRSHRTILDLARLPRGPQHFELRPEAPERALLAEELAINAVRKLRFAGTLEPEGARDWRLVAELGATVVQPCVVTLAPVTTRIDTHVTRGYLADWQEPTGEEAEMPEDDTTEPLPARLDLGAVMLEALALALPDLPARARRGARGRPVRRAGYRADDRRGGKKAAGGPWPLFAIACATNRRTRTGGRRAARTVEKKGRRKDGRRPNPPRRGPRKPVLKRTCMTTESEYVPGLARPW